MSSCSSTMCWKKLSFLRWTAFRSLSKISWAYLCGSVSGFCICSIDFLHQHHSLDYSSCIISLEIGETSSFYFIFLCQNCFSYSSSFAFPYRFYNDLVCIAEILAGILIGIMLKLYVNLERTDIFTMMSLAICVLSLHLFRSLISFNIL